MIQKRYIKALRKQQSPQVERMEKWYQEFAEEKEAITGIYDKFKAKGS